MTDPTIIEAAGLAIKSYYDNLPPSAKAFSSPEEALQVIVAAVTPLIRAAALEEAASMAEEYFSDNTISGVSPQWVADEIAAMLRALKEQP